MGSGFTNDVLHAENVDFSGGFPVEGKVIADGQLLIGSTVAPNIRVATLTAGANVTITNGAGTIQIAATNSGGDVVGPGSATDNALVRFDGTTGKLVQNGVITEDDTGNLSQSASVSGASLSMTTANTSNTASATAFHRVQVAGTTASDAYYQADISGGQNWTWGLDNSDSDSWVLSASGTPGTTNVMRVATTGEINYPLQPAFFANGAGGTDVTGNSTTFVVGTGGTAYTEIYDQNGDFNTNGTFTAPVTGRYHFDSTIQCTGFLSAHTQGFSSIAASNRSAQGPLVNPFAAMGVAANGFSFVATTDIDMDAADTCVNRVTVESGTLVVDVTADARTHFSGHLVC